MTSLLCLSLGARAEPKDDSVKSANECGELGDCPSSPMNCHEKCGCDRFAAYHYNETTGMCVLTFKHLMIPKVKVYVEYDPRDVENEHQLSKAIRVEAEKIFKTILISVVIFITCCAICVISACLYCCRITYIDYLLNKDIKVLARKLKRNETIKKGPKRPKLPNPVGESCNIVCEDAGVFVV
ncbi:hypothetical protein evm_003143 [Chilo suppressalis]|nr:hypothetical protein evm_003143 [Chilo suppressalis]